MESEEPCAGPNNQQQPQEIHKGKEKQKEPYDDNEKYVLLQKLQQLRLKVQHLEKTVHDMDMERRRWSRETRILREEKDDVIRAADIEKKQGRDAERKSRQAVDVMEYRVQLQREQIARLEEQVEQLQEENRLLVQNTKDEPLCIICYDNVALFAPNSLSPPR